MKTPITISFALGLALLALIALGLFIVRPVLAQVVATSTEFLLGTTTPAESIDSVSASTTPRAAVATTTPPDPIVLGESAAAATEPAPVPPTSADAAPAAESAAAGGLVEVQLQCPMSYVGLLYDTPSGHLDEGYFLGEPAASTTGMTAAHEIGTQAWTVCHDNESNTYEFKITQEEYDSHKIRGTPKKSVMKPAAAASAPAAEPPATSSESTATPTASTTPDTPTPEVLGAATSTEKASITLPDTASSTESASTSTPPSNAQSPAAQSTSTPIE